MIPVQPQQAGNNNSPLRTNWHQLALQDGWSQNITTQLTLDLREPPQLSSTHFQDGPRVELWRGKYCVKSCSVRLVGQGAAQGVHVVLLEED